MESVTGAFAEQTRDDKAREVLKKELEIETIAEKVHIAYCEQYKKKKGKPYWTDGDYSKLDEATKEYDRVTVRTVLTALCREKKIQEQVESRKQLEDYVKGLEKRLKKIDRRMDILLSFEGVYSLAARNRIKEIHKLADVKSND